MSAVTDALNRHWPQWQDWVALTRLNRPIGSYLLLGPTLWALWIAAQGVPDWHLLGDLYPRRVSDALGRLHHQRRCRPQGRRPC